MSKYELTLSAVLCLAFSTELLAEKPVLSEKDSGWYQHDLKRCERYFHFGSAGCNPYDPKVNCELETAHCNDFIETFKPYKGTPFKDRTSMHEDCDIICKVKRLIDGFSGGSTGSLIIRDSQRMQMQ